MSISPSTTFITTRPTAPQKATASMSRKLPKTSARPSSSPVKRPTVVGFIGKSPCGSRDRVRSRRGRDLDVVDVHGDTTTIGGGADGSAHVGGQLGNGGAPAGHHVDLDLVRSDADAGHPPARQVR